MTRVFVDGQTLGSSINDLFFTTQGDAHEWAVK